MRSWDQQPLPDGRGQRVALRTDNRATLFSEVLALWRDDAEFRIGFTELLAQMPYAAYFWECPPITADTVRRPFEFVIVETPSLATVSPEPNTFAAQWTAADVGIAVFWNLGRDAFLVAPAPFDPLEAGAHLAAFSRRAPTDLQHVLWRAVGVAVARHLSSRPLWLSTSGLGVSWLHIRLDSRPKYHSHGPYRDARPPARLE